MNFEELFNSIRSHFSVVATTLGLTVVYDNITVDPPDDDAWLRITILPDDSVKADIGSGNDRFRTTGMVFVDIFTPLNIGDKRALEIADTVSDHFRARTVSGVRYRTPKLMNMNRLEDWHHKQVSIPFYADAFAS